MRQSDLKSDETEDSFRLLFHNHPLPMWICDLETFAFLQVNDAAIRSYGYERKEFLNMTLTDIRPPEDAARALDRNAELRRELQESSERRHRLKNGRIVTVQVNSHTLMFHGRNAALVISQDITERKRAEDALRENESRLRAMFECSRDAIGVSKNGIHIFANPSYLKLFGFENNQTIVGTSILGSIAPVHRQLITQNVQRRAKGVPAAKFYHARGLRADGTEFDAEFSVSTYELDGEVYSVATIRDITERNLAEEKLRESEQRYHLVVDNLKEVVFHMDSGGRCIFLNPAWEDITGFGVEESVGRLLLDIIHPDDRQRSTAQFQALLDRKKSYCRHEIRLVTRVGCLRWIEVYAQAGLNDQKQVIGIYGTLTDITERKDAQEALRQSEEMYRKLVATSPDAITAVDLSGHITLATSKALEIFGLTSEREALERSVFEWVAPEDQGKALANMQELLATGKTKYQEFLLKRENGERFHAELNASLIQGPDKCPTGAIIVTRDVTARKRAEESLRESEERFRQLSEAALEGIAITETGILLDGNTRLAAMLGYDLAEMIGRPVADFIAPISRATVLKNIAQHFEQGYEHFLLRKDGSTVPVESHARMMTWNGRTMRVTALLDISERKRAEEQLHQLSLAVEQSPASIVITDTQGNIEYVNPKFTQITGYTREEACGKNPRILKSGESSPEVYEELWRTITAGREWRGEFHNRKKNGDLFWEMGSISPVKDKNNVITNFVAVKEDITERKKAERELRLMAQTVASARDCINITDLEGRLLFVNDALRYNYGYTTEELIGKDVSILRSPHTPTAITNRILPDTLAGGWHGEVYHRRKDGSDLPVELWTSVVKDEAGMPVALVGVARNITDRMIAEQTLRESEEQFRLIAENVADMIAVLDLDGRRIYNSPSYSNILGDPELLKGTDGFREIHPEDAERIKHVFRETARTGVGQKLEYRLLGKDGSTRNIESKGSVIRNRDGRISRVVVVSRDVTEEKKLAAQFLRAQRMESIGTLAGGIAHDLNNVLAPIMMAIEVLRQKIADPGGQRILSTIGTSAQRGSDIVKQVLAFGRGVKGERVVVQLKHIVNDVVKISGETFPKSISIKEDIPRDLWTVSADPTQMHQVLLNLLVNARDAMPRGGTLTISAENIKFDDNYSRMHLEAKPGAYVSITITDTGTGIPAAIREKIFEPFFTTKDIGMGTGLGLSTTLAIVKSHGGFINLGSEVGKGATFSVYIPATGLASQEATSNEATAPPRGHGELILVIDDEAGVREISKETLEAYGYRTLTASDGVDGVAVFADNKNDIKAVITDIMMPVMDGTATIVALRKINPNVKIIAASGLTAKGQTTGAIESNVEAFLTKPYTAETLLNALAAVIQQ